MANAGINYVNHCDICGQKYAVNKSGYVRFCSYGCWIDDVWRWYLKQNNTPYYHNPNTHDKLGQRLAR